MEKRRMLPRREIFAKLEQTFLANALTYGGGLRHVSGLLRIILLH